MRRGEVERQQIADVSVWRSLWQLCEHVKQVGIRLDVTGPARKRQAVDHGARLGASYSVCEEPCLSTRAEWSDVALYRVVVHWSPSIADVTAQIFPLIARVDDSLAQ